MSKPPPFKRPSVQLGKHGRVWTHVPATKLIKGDLVASRGLISWTQLDGGNYLCVGFVNGDEINYKLDELVLAFVRKND